MTEALIMVYYEDSDQWSNIGMINFIAKQISFRQKCLFNNWIKHLKSKIKSKTKITKSTFSKK